MIRRSFLFFSVIMFLLTTSCVKENYDMNKLSKEAHLSPTFAISAIKGDITLNDIDIFKSSDNVFIGPDNFVKIIYRRDSILDLKLSDFISLKSGIRINENGKAQLDSNLLNKNLILLQLVATFEPYTLNLGIGDILSHLSGDIYFSNPSLILNYSNSFFDPIEINLNATGKRNGKTVDLNLAPFTLLSPVAPNPEVISSFVIDKSNSLLDSLVSLPPEEITFSGSATMTIAVKSAQAADYLLSPNSLIGSIDLEIPLNLKLNNVSFADTVKNFLKVDNNGNDNPVKPENIEFLRVIVNALNGFPVGVSVEMSLYNSVSHDTISIKPVDTLDPAPVDNDGIVKPLEITEKTLTIEFNRRFFSSINQSDKIIFKFILNTTDNSSKDVKIYSNYRIDFNAALVLKPDIKLK